MVYLYTLGAGWLDGQLKFFFVFFLFVWREREGKTKWVEDGGEGKFFFLWVNFYFQDRENARLMVRDCAAKRTSQSLKRLLPIVIEQAVTRVSENTPAIAKHAGKKGFQNLGEKNNYWMTTLEGAVLQRESEGSFKFCLQGRKHAWWPLLCPILTWNKKMACKKKKNPSSSSE